MRKHTEIVAQTVLVIVSISSVLLIVVFFYKSFAAFLDIRGEQAMTNEEIITQTQLCEAAGLYADTIINGFTYRIEDIQCAPLTNRTTEDNSK